jgi:endonuclease/exonuclease/phosphatase family metal-dependent hydrolase
MTRWHVFFLTLAGALTLAAAESAAPFTIVSYNIHHGASPAGVLDIPKIGAVLAAAAPRFAGLQEVDQKTRRVGRRDTCALLAAATGMHATFAKGIDLTGGEYGVALLSRERPLQVRRLPLPGTEPRVLLLCEFADCWVGTCHLDLTRAARLASIAIVEKAVRACGGKPVFLTGDWNASPQSAELAAVRRFSRILSPVDTATFHGRKLPENQRHNPKRCIDYVTVDAAHASAYDVVSARVVDERTASDHAPVAVTLRRR